MSTIAHDDPRLTAYALGELPAGERAAIEKIIALNPALQAEVDQIRALSGDLTRELATELVQTPTLTVPQRKAISGAATGAAQPNRWRVVIGWSAFTTAAAATIAFMILPTIGLVGERSPQGIAMTPVTTAAPVSESEFQRKLSAPVHAPISAPVLIGDQEVKDILIADAQQKTSTISLEGKRASVPEAVVTEDAQDSMESGSTGAFMAIGRSGGARSALAAKSAAKPDDADLPRGREEAVALDAPAERVYAQSPATASSPFTPSRPSATAANAADAKARRPAAPPVGGFRLSGTPAEFPTTPSVTPGGETYNQRADHSFLSSQSDPLSTFGLDVDTASYGNVRRMIEGGRLPPRDAVRVEELVNYFPYDDVPAPTDGEAFGVMVEVAPCPWQPAHKLARIAVRGQAVTTRPALNLVFLVDVSGSMKPDNRLPLIKTGLSLLANSLTEHDHVTIVTYTGSAGVALPTTAGNDQRTILKAVDHLNADGSTNGGSGIQMAYDAARAAFERGGVNRVILCTDGDFNVGVTNREELVRLVQTRAKEGVFLTVLGVGQDNLKDATMELLADKANGHYHYLDSIAEARKVLVEQISGTLVTIAKDAKAQVEFNPARVAAWRQLGYEKRQMAAQDFANDRKDGGEVGADHIVTVLYELVPAELGNALPEDGLRYQPAARPAATVVDVHSRELLTVKLRYKTPTGSTSRMVQGMVTDEQVRQAPSIDQRFAGAVAAFALRLRGSDAMGLEFAAIASEARRALGHDPQGYRREFVQLVERAAALNQGPAGRE